MVEWLLSAAREFGASFSAVSTPGAFLYWPHLLSYGLIALAVLVWRRRRQSELAGDGGLLAALFPRAIYTHPSARHDAILYVLDRVVLVLAFIPRLGLALAVAVGVSTLLTTALGARPAIVVGPWATAAFTAFEVLVADLGLFLTHLLAHRLGPLWCFHKVHHSAPVLTPMSAKRFHPLEVIEDQLVMDLCAGVVYGLGYYVSGGSLSVFTVLAVNVVDFSWNLCGAHLRHSHVWLAYPRWLSRILISPAMHQIHHSVEARHYDKNLGNIFAFWDWLAGSLYIPEGREELRFGLGPEGEGHERLFGLLLRPFIDLGAWFRGLAKPAEPTPADGDDTTGGQHEGEAEP